MLKDLELYGQVVIERLGSTESAESELIIDSAKYGMVVSASSVSGESVVVR